MAVIAILKNIKRGVHNNLKLRPSTVLALKRHSTQSDE